MEKEFTPYEQALELKELGFNEPCLAQYRKYDVGESTLDIGFSKNEIIMQFHKLSKFCSAPLYQQAFRWFRDKHSFIGISTISNYSNDRYVFDIFQKGNEEIYFEGSDLSYRNNGNKEYNTYEEAELACLIKLIEIVKTK